MDRKESLDKKQREWDQIVAGALDNIKVYVENGRQEAFIQIKPPQLTKFQLPEATDQDQKDPPDSQNLMECDGVDATAVDRWNQNEVLQVNLIKEEDMEHFGKTLTDEVTGEQYMLLPIDVDILINPDTLPTPVSVKEHLEDFDKETEGNTFYLQSPEEQHRQEPVGSLYCRHEFKIPKLNLNFQLVLVSEPKEAKDDSQLNLGQD